MDLHVLAGFSPLGAWAHGGSTQAAGPGGMWTFASSESAPDECVIYFMLLRSHNKNPQGDGAFLRE